MTAGLAELYAEHQPAALRLARSLAPAADADDLVAESFARVVATMNQGRHPREFRPYLLATVRNQAAGAARGRHRLVLVPDLEPPAAPGADELAIRRDEAGRAARAFASLSQRWQAVLWATEVEGRRPAELADRFGLPANGVAQLAVRAREGLRQAYLAQHAGSAPRGCRPFASLLPAGTRGRLPARQQARLDRHVTGCARCAALAGELSALNENLGMLLGPGALTAGSLSAGRRALPSLLHRHMLLALSSAAATAAALTAMVPLPVTGHAPVPAPARSQVHAPARAGDPPLPPARPYVPRHARDHGGDTGPGSALSSGAGLSVPQAARDAAAGVTAGATPVMSAAGQVITTAGQAVSTAVSAASQVTGTVMPAVTAAIPRVAPAAVQAASPVAATAGLAVAGAGQQLGAAVSGLAGAAGQAVSSAVPAAAPAGQLAARTGQDAGADVTAVTGQAGQLVSGAGSAVTGELSQAVPAVTGSLPGGL